MAQVMSEDVNGELAAQMAALPGDDAAVAMMRKLGNTPESVGAAVGVALTAVAVASKWRRWLPVLLVMVAVVGEGG